MANSVQQQVIDLVIKEGMTEAEAITLIEARLRGKLTDSVKASIKEELDAYYRKYTELWK